MRNFNFRCNLDEIDKIIEEDCEKPDEPDLNSNTLGKKKKDVSITRLKQSRKISRKEWNINPRKSIGKKRESSKDGRPRAGLRINR